MEAEDELKELCISLSDLFAASDIDYKQIANKAAKYQINQVENALFNLVGPVLWRECYSTTPEVWGYSGDWLWSEIQNNLTEERNSNTIKKAYFDIRSMFIRWTIRDEWNRLKDEIHACKSQASQGQ
ncbi:hypothetical protein HA052_04675 [Chromobacterium haemolyticum]|uniref:DUF7079 domain-containing protein n=1 Tax=Chromobacterium fluminis TaxID=3044269 RepID=A0ABX0L842_9NEIS|nr:hypothetical protein [Chromobacterium haemolyticum]NHR04485.1 hypothetical protein [Chromobacterium haemolyticum]